MKLVIILLVILLLPAVFAERTQGALNKVTEVDSIRSDFANENQVFSTVFLDLRGKERADNIRIAAVIPELGVRGSAGPFSTRHERIAKTVLLDLPADVKKGEYVVRYTITRNGEKRIKHRILTID